MKLWRRGWMSSASIVLWCLYKGPPTMGFCPYISFDQPGEANSRSQLLHDNKGTRNIISGYHALQLAERRMIKPHMRRHPGWWSPKRCPCFPLGGWNGAESLDPIVIKVSIYPTKCGDLMWFRDTLVLFFIFRQPPCRIKRPCRWNGWRPGLSGGYIDWYADLNVA